MDFTIGPVVLHFAGAGIPSFVVIRGDRITTDTKPIGVATAAGHQFKMKTVSVKAGRIVLALYDVGLMVGAAVPAAEPDSGTVSIPLDNPPVTLGTDVEYNNDPPPPQP